MVTAAPGHRPRRAAQTSLGSVLKDKQLLQNCPKQAAQSRWTLDKGWWLKGWACAWVRVVEFVIH